MHPFDFVSSRCSENHQNMKSEIEYYSFMILRQTPTQFNDSVVFFSV